MKKILHLLFVLLFVLSAASCSTAQVLPLFKPKKIDVNSKIVLGKIELAEKDYPFMGQLWVSAYKGNEKKVQAEIASVEAKGVENLNLYYLEKFKSATGAEVLMSESPISLNNFDVFSDADKPEFADKVAEFCRANGSDYAVLSVTRVRIPEVYTFARKGLNLIESGMFVFDSNGKLVGKGKYVTDYIGMPPKDMKLYAEVFESAKPMAGKLIDSLFK